MTRNLSYIMSNGAAINSLAIVISSLGLQPIILQMYMHQPLSDVSPVAGREVLPLLWDQTISALCYIYYKLHFIPEHA